MKFGVREIANVVFRAKNDQLIGGIPFKAGQPVLYIDSAKTSTLEGAATSVYATGGRGNVRLISWEGEKTLTFTVEDALLSPVSFAMLSGAGLIKGKVGDGKQVHFHQTSMAVIGSDDEINLTDALEASDTICETAPLYVLETDEGGDLTGNIWALDTTDAVIGDGKKVKVGAHAESTDPNYGLRTSVLVDYYVIKNAASISEMQIDAEHFAGYYYVEADTLFRRQHDGKDLPANITMPNVKIQSNFTFSMASSGDPSTFTFTMDALPGYTYFEPTKKVLCAIQIVEDSLNTDDDEWKTVFPHSNTL